MVGQERGGLARLDVSRLAQHPACCQTETVLTAFQTVLAASPSLTRCACENPMKRIAKKESRASYKKSQAPYLRGVELAGDPQGLHGVVVRGGLVCLDVRAYRARYRISRRGKGHLHGLVVLDVLLRLHVYSHGGGRRRSRVVVQVRRGGSGGG